MKQLILRGVVLGEGIPKICIPIKASSKEELWQMAMSAEQRGADFLEVRADYFSADMWPDQAAQALVELRSRYTKLPILFTYRSCSEGGRGTLDSAGYLACNRRILESGGLDLLDVEVTAGTETVSALRAEAHRQGIPLLFSHHDLSATPPLEDLIRYGEACVRQGADAIKLAVTPKHAADVARLLQACACIQEQCQIPLIGISSGQRGAISRVAGEVFGNALVFGCLDREAGVSGQIPVQELKALLELVHNYCTI